SCRTTGSGSRRPASLTSARRRPQAASAPAFSAGSSATVDRHPARAHRFSTSSSARRQRPYPSSSAERTRARLASASSSRALSVGGVGVAVTLTLAGSAALTWLVRRPAERYGARAALLALGALSAVAAVIFLSSRDPRLVVLAAILGNVAVGTGETGPFLTLEQVRI